jgi:peptidyl-prolyl cis-trans isomerase C
MDFSRVLHSSRAMMGRWLREPLVQFLCIGAAIFAVTHLLDPSSERTQQPIVIDSALTRRLAQLYHVQTGIAPGPAELDSLVASYVHEEALYREALKLGLDKDDEIIRRRLVQKMEFLNSDLTSPPTPTEGELRRYFAAHASEFATPATVSFTHLYFSTDRRGEEGARLAAMAALRGLPSQQPGVRGETGDPFPLQSSYAELSESDLAQVFGHAPLVAALFAAPTGRWCGPFRSGLGWHLVFVSHRVERREASFEIVKAQVQNAAEEAQRRLAQERWDRAVESRYAVVRDDHAPEHR